jgi:phage terminase large subunit-like protein
MNKEQEQQVEYLKLLKALEEKLKYNKFDSMFPNDGRFKRDLYPKHLSFFKAGKKCSKRLLAGGNRVGKTFAGAYEMACHLTGYYPEWWEGKKFINPVSCWAAGISITVVREVMQKALLGPLEDLGTGMIPKDAIISVTRKTGVPETIDKVRIKHRSGGISQLVFKSYEQGRLDFQGDKKDVIWLDEEPKDEGIYEECLPRLMDDVNPGIIYMTFTPLLGLTNLVSSFLEGGRFSENGFHPEDKSKFAVQVTWEDVPHLSAEQKEEIIQSISPHLRDARTKGIPHLGAGVVYPYNEDFIVVDPFEIPVYWPKGYGLDVGWNRTAAIWVAFDPDDGVYYLYSEHYMGESVPVVHASAIKARGDWIPGVIDTASLRANELDGRCMYDQYANEGLNLEMANKAIEAGVLKINQLLAAGRIKVFSTLLNWLKEFRTYRRDEKTGKIADKQEDHLMDAWRYIMMSCPDILMLEPDPDEYKGYRNRRQDQDNITGY